MAVGREPARIQDRHHVQKMDMYKFMGYARWKLPFVIPKRYNYNRVCAPVTRPNSGSLITKYMHLGYS